MNLSECAPMPRGRKPVSKVTKFGWTIVDQPGEFRMIDKNDLRTDDTYQRALSPARVQKIRGEWSWIACGILEVADRGDAGLWLIDGQHRHAAAMSRSDIKDLPCLVFRCEDIKAEALGWLGANVTRKSPTWIERHRAGVVACDIDALVVQQGLDETNIVLRDNPPSGIAEMGTRAVHALYMALQRNRKRFVEALTGSIALCPDNSLTKDEIDSVSYLVSLLPYNRRLPLATVARAKSRFRSAVARRAAMGEPRGAKQVAAVLANLANKGLRSDEHKLPEVMT